LFLHDLLSLYVLKYVKRNKSKLDNDQNGRAFYDQFFNDYHVWEYSYDIKALLRRKQILGYINKLSLLGDYKIVDIGSGICDILTRIEDECQLLGIEYSKNSILLAKRFSGPRIMLLQGDATNLPFKDNSINVIICCEVIEHIRDDEGAFRELHRILHPNGRLILSVPNGHYFSEYLELIGHYRHYSRANLENLITLSGMQIDESLNMYPRFIFIYFYIFLSISAINQVINAIFNQNANIYQRSIFGIYFYRDLLTPILLFISKIDNINNAYNLSKSTFISCKKQNSVR
jgi:ubiquinone/menaquinone biosynthesis C-methylase UbiE